MIARVTLEIALRKEFDYLIPPEMAAQVDVGSRVKVPFGPRQVMGCVTALIEESTHTNLRSITRVVGKQTLVTPRVLALARWIAEYYCCAPEIALKSVLPEAIRKEEDGWRERLFVRLVPQTGEMPKLTKRQQELWHIIEEHRELPLQRLLELSGTTADTVRRLEDKGLVTIANQISERDPYAHEQIIPTQPLPLHEEQARALAEIKRAMQRAAGILPAEKKITEQSASPFYEREAETGKYRGELPHWRQGEKLYFVTFRLADSIAQNEIAAWSEEKKIWEKLHPHPRSESQWEEYHQRFTERFEKLLDAGYGKCVMADSAISQIVESTIRHFDGARYRLGDFVIMPNHVHVLVQPLHDEPLEKIIHSWKSYSAKLIGDAQGAAGTIWKDEYFDHLVRSLSQWQKFSIYVKQNPIKAHTPTGRYRLGNGSFEAYVKGQFSDCRQDAGSTLKAMQGNALSSAESETPSKEPVNTFLLHGVTGSGKTEVYLQGIAHALEQGKGAIVLVPEIALTPQTVERFKARFSSGPLQTLVAVLHSHLSAGERHDEWHKIRQGRARIVIGARSAIFAPVEPLGLIIVDEEHEHSYKQEEAPRYHARDVAVLRGQRENAVVVLGSATPSMESYFNAQKGKYKLLEMPTRADDKKMPIVRVVDMRQAMRGDKGTPIFSPKLKEAITQRLERSEQTMLFLNRRGYSTSLQCPKCGYVAECPNCSVSLTYHRQAQKLLCHTCGHEAKPPSVCPEKTCRNPDIRYAGLGTERVESTLAKLFPQARIRRMDSDTLKRKEDYRKILGDFRTGKIDILVGTQMIAKGLHFPNVTLVGIIYADLSLHLPDFRAGERTFQLLTQVAGRAGRGDIEGEVFVQAFTPFHPAIQYARKHDYLGFYEQEMEFREQLRYPPFARVALLTLKGRNEDKVSFSADHIRKLLERDLIVVKDVQPAPVTPPKGEELFAVDSAPLRTPIPDLILAGPAPAPLLRAETFYRYQVMLRTKQMSRLSHYLAKMSETLSLPEDVTLTIDIDPVNLM